MTLAQFSELDELAQVEVLWHIEAIAERWENGFQVFLFPVDAFYVEFYYHVHRESLEKIRAFSDTEYLAVYLEKINIDQLLHD